jgi:hypothetical protein
MDYDHDYDLDLILLGDTPALLRNEGTAGFADRTADFPFAKGAPAEALKLRVAPDSKAFDLAVFYSDRAPVLYRDQLGGRYTAEAYEGQPPAADRSRLRWRWTAGRARIGTDGKASPESEPWNQPVDPRHFGVSLAGAGCRGGDQDRRALPQRRYEGALLVSIPELAPCERFASPAEWSDPERNEPGHQPYYTYKEATPLRSRRRSGPEWQGISSSRVPGRPLGERRRGHIPSGPDEHAIIPGASLAADGQYDIRITEELSEALSRPDQLFAVDHPAGTEIFTNEKFKGPPYPEFRLFGVQQPST